jgi:hypothetical protein
MMHAGAPTAFVLGLERFVVACPFIGRIRPLIPKHNCAIVDVVLGFHHGHAKEDETHSGCR